MANPKLTKDYAQQMDSQDKLAYLRNRFYIPEGVTYMDGNSLGLLSKDAEDAVTRVMHEWKHLAIRGWLEAERSWFHYGEYLGQQLAPLIGASAEEVVITNSTTINIHHLLATFYKPGGKRRKIIIDELNFPTDTYAIKAQMALKGTDIEKDLIVVPSRDGKSIEEEDIIAAMSEEVAVAFLPSVLYRSGQLLDMQRLTAEAHAKGILIGFDLCHSAGVIPHKLSAWDIDFAVWCNYKYLNSGPGSIAGLYVNKRRFGTVPALSGWWGHEKQTQFEMRSYFTPENDAGGWQIGTVHLLSAAPLEGSLKIFAEVGIEAIREKSLQLTTYMMELIDAELSQAPYNYTIGTPRPAERRGGHVAVEHPTEALRINEALKQRGVIGDFRPPRVIRLAPSPLYNTFEDVWNVVQHLKEIIDHEEYSNFSLERGAVT